MSVRRARTRSTRRVGCRSEALSNVGAICTWSYWRRVVPGLWTVAKTGLAMLPAVLLGVGNVAVSPGGGASHGRAPLVLALLVSWTEGERGTQAPVQYCNKRRTCRAC